MSCRKSLPAKNFCLTATIAVWLCSSPLAVYGQQTRPSYWLLTANYSQLVFSSDQHIYLAMSHDHRTVDYLDPKSRSVIHTLTLPGAAIPFQSMTVSRSDGRRASIILGDKRLCLLDVASKRLTTIDFQQLTGDPFVCGTVAGLGPSAENDGACVWIPPLAPYHSTVTACGSAAVGGSSLCHGYPALENSWGVVAQHPNGRWIFEIEPPPFGTNQSFVQHFETARPASPTLCPSFVRQRAVDWANFEAPRWASFSLDGGVMFLSNGMTMTVADAEQYDLTFGPTFNNSVSPMSFVDMKHLANSKNEIAVLARTYSEQAGLQLVVQMFDWPSLMPLKRTFSIPIPQGVGEPHHMYIDDYHFSLDESPEGNRTLYVVVTYAYDFMPHWIPAIVYIQY